MSAQVGLTPRRRWFAGDRAWALSFLGVAVVIFIFFMLVTDNSFDPSVNKFANTWFPLQTINLCMIYAICALGLNIVVGYAGLLDLGFVAFWAIGGFVAGWLMSAHFDSLNIKLGGTPAPFTSGGIHVHYVLVLIAGAAVCGLFGVIIGAPTLRLRSDYLALVTLAFGEIIPEVFRNGDNVFGANISNGDLGIGPLDPVKSLSFDRSNGFSWKILGPFDYLGRYLLFVILTALILFVSLRIRSGRLGRAWLAIREDELAASAMGVPLMRSKLAAYAVGAVAGGIGGVAFAIHVRGVFPANFDFSISITLLAMVVLGGMGNVWGVMIGALGLAWFNATGLREGGDAFNSTFGTNINFTRYTFLVFGLALVLMMLFRREGVIPETRTRMVLREPGRTEMESLGSDMEQPAPELERALAHEGQRSADAPGGEEQR
jgi:branched-chain amino acid transport system permease protein